MTATGPHAGQKVATAGIPLDDAEVVLLMAHGRGADAADMIALAEQIGVGRVAVLAPQAAGNSWWPASFLAPLGQNASGLLSGLSVLKDLSARIAERGVPVERTVLVGFSQGACLALEFAARHPVRFGAVIGLSGGLVGTTDAPGPARGDLYGHADKRFDYTGDMAGTPVVLACHARDPHIPLARVERSAQVFEDLGAEVITRIAPGAGHGVTAQALAEARNLIGQIRT